MINNPYPNEDEQTLREYLLPGALPNHVFSAKSIGRLLKQHLDEPVRSGERTLVLRSWEDKHSQAARLWRAHHHDDVDWSAGFAGFAGFVLAPPQWCGANLRIGDSKFFGPRA